MDDVHTSSQFGESQDLLNITGVPSMVESMKPFKSQGKHYPCEAPLQIENFTKESVWEKWN